MARRRSVFRGARWLVPALLLVVAQAAILYAMGQPPICECGRIVLWQGDVTGPENSQQVTDC